MGEQETQYRTKQDFYKSTNNTPERSTMMKTIYKLTLAALLATGLLLLSACAAESDTPTTVGTTVAPTPSVTTVATTTDAPIETTTPQVTTTQQTPATSEPATSELTTSEKPATTEEPAPVTTEAPSLVEQMASMGCPKELIPTVEREANAEELAKIDEFLSDPYVIALLVDGFFTPEEIDLRGFIEMGVLLSDYTTPNGTPSPEEERDVALAIGDLGVIQFDCIRWTSAELDAVVQKYLGVSISDVYENMFVDRDGTKFPFASIHYLSQYDAYYMVCPNFIEPFIGMISAYRTADGNYLVHYHGSTNKMVTILTPYEGSFRISLVMELSPNPYAPIQ